MYVVEGLRGRGKEAGILIGTHEKRRLGERRRLGQGKWDGQEARRRRGKKRRQRGRGTRRCGCSS
jgi:hypothetical protein